MTDYPASGRASASWKKHENKRKFQNILAIFITFLLSLAIVNGFVKSFSLKKQISQSKWDSNSSFTALLSTSPPSVFVYQPDPKRIAFFPIDESSHLATSTDGTALTKVGDLVKENDLPKLTKATSIAFGADINNYLELKGKVYLKKEQVQKSIEKFTSIAHLFSLIKGESGMNTNISRLDAIRLWWQLKNIRTDKLEIADSHEAEEEKLLQNKKVLGVDETSLHLIISPYLENRELTSGVKIEIKNASGSPTAGRLAGEFVDSIGFEIANYEESEQEQDESNVLSPDKDETSKFLASMFACRVTEVSGSSKAASVVTVVIGRDFAIRYTK